MTCLSVCLSVLVFYSLAFGSRISEVICLICYFVKTCQPIKMRMMMRYYTLPSLPMTYTRWSWVRDIPVESPLFPGRIQLLKFMVKVAIIHFSSLSSESPVRDCWAGLKYDTILTVGGGIWSRDFWKVRKTESPDRSTGIVTDWYCWVVKCETPLVFVPYVQSRWIEFVY